MKPILLFIFTGIVVNTHAQQADTTALKARKVFLRLYDANEKKIGDGRFVASTDSTLQLVRKWKKTIIPIMVVNSIRPKHDGGYSILIGTYIGLSVSAVAALIAGDKVMSDNIQDNQLAHDMGVLGIAAPIAGLIGGGIAESSRKINTTYFIHGNTAEWLVVKGQLGL